MNVNEWPWQNCFKLLFHYKADTSCFCHFSLTRLNALYFNGRSIDIGSERIMEAPVMFSCLELLTSDEWKRQNLLHVWQFFYLCSIFLRSLPFTWCYLTLREGNRFPFVQHCVLILLKQIDKVTYMAGNTTLELQKPTILYFMEVLMCL